MYKQWRAEVQIECKICKRNYYNNKVAALKDINVKRWWKEIKGIAGQRDSHDWFYQMLNDTLTSPDVLAEHFNNFLSDLTAHFSPLEASSGVLPEVPSGFLVDVNKTYRALRQIKLNKSPGPDIVPNKIWKEFAWELAPVLSDIYNTSLRQGLVPSQLKESLVRSIPKCSPPKTIANDLRPITCQVAKLMKGFTLDSLYNQIVDKLDDKQSALPGKSCSHALVYLLHHIFASLDRGNCFARILFTDFSKGFDLVDHNVLIEELRSLGVHEVLVRWVGPFLSDRSQRVSLCNTLSPAVIPRGGIPHETKLAPILFAVLVNKLTSNWNLRAKYVDDLTIVEIIQRCSFSMLPIIANEIGTFAVEHGMRLNGPKCKDMLIEFLRYKPFPTTPIFINGVPIEQASSKKG